MTAPAPPPWSDWWTGARRALYVAAWLACLLVVGQRLDRARTEFGPKPTTPVDQRRADGNSGHAQIDFGGQWVMGRMVLTGHARDLYDRREQWRVVRAGFPRSGESAFVHRNAFPAHLRDPGVSIEDARHDDDALMWWFMGTDPPEWDAVGTAVALPVTADALGSPLTAVAAAAVAHDQLTPELVAAADRKAVGGPLYPPVHGFLYAPLAVLDPRPAYLAFQALTVALTFAAGLGVSRLSRGRVWWPVATTLVMLWPGYRSGLDLAQNQVVTLTILVWGWVLAARGRDGWGGVVWGLLAFKPVWAATFFLAPLLMRRWRFCAAMAGAGVALGAATLPFTGVQPWLDWLAVGREASDLYLVNKSWVHLSRDVSGIPRRLLLDFTLPESERNTPTADLASRACLAAVLATTAVVYLWRGRREFRTGLGAGFVLLGAYLGCYRFMYYDSLLAVLPAAVLFADPRRFAWPPGRWVGVGLLAAVLAVDDVWLRYGGRVCPAATTLDWPWETFALLLLWAWCGARLVWEGDWGEPASRHPA